MGKGKGGERDCKIGGKLVWETVNSKLRHQLTLMRFMEAYRRHS